MDIKDRGTQTSRACVDSSAQTELTGEVVKSPPPEVVEYIHRHQHYHIHEHRGVTLGTSRGTSAQSAQRRNSDLK